MEFSPILEQIIAIADDKHNLTILDIADLKAPKEVTILSGHSDIINCLTFPSYEKDIVITAGMDKLLIIWNWKEEVIYQKLYDHKSVINAILFLENPFYQYLATGDNKGAVHIWQLSIYSIIQTCKI